MTLSLRSWRRAALAVAVAGATTLGVTVATGATGTAAGATYPACTASQLRAWWGMPSDGAAGGFYYQLQFSNLSGTTCSLRGFPGISAVDSHQQQVGSPAGWDHRFPATTVVLTPGATAHAVLRVTDVDVYPKATCQPVTATALRVFPPNQRAAVTVPLSVRACAKKGPVFLSVRVVRPLTGIPGYSQ